VQNPAIGFYLLGFVVAIVTSLVLTYAVRERAKRARLFDGPDARKVHSGNIPRVGGLAIFLSVVVALGAVQLLARDVDFGTRGTGLRIVLAGGAAVFLVGLWDDIRSLRASTKLVLQVAIAVAVYAGGLRVETLALPFVGVVHFGPIVSLAFTLVWLVGITNAFNLIDGLDGLAGGAAMFALTTMFVVGSINGRPGAALVTIVVAGATLGFLVYNFNPASIFLGDSGSLFLGFTLAGLGLLSSQKSQTIVAVAIPIVSLGLPVLDTMLAIVRRFLRGQPIFMADRGHIHHRLLSLGHSPRQVALLLYGACALLALGGMLLVNNSEYVALVLVLFGLGVGFAIQRLRFAEFEELARLVRKGVRQRGVIGRSVRMREISAQLASVDDLGTLFHALERAFGDDGFQRAEVRLRRSFLDTHDGGGRDRRFEDDVPVWSWIRPAGANAACWEIKLPLVDAGGGRIGAMVLWQDGLADETSLSHIHTIARELRQVVQAKLLALWHSSPYERSYERAMPLASGEVPAFRRGARDPQPTLGTIPSGLAGPSPSDAAPIVPPTRGSIDQHPARAANVGS
jgi:UDP-GlcNAc:undecaprenyl-phosphate GlcNAc-1-phosphate transferase